MNNKILFLYSEVLPYTIAVIEALIEEFNCEVTLVHWDKKKLTPYDFEITGANVIPRSVLDLQKLNNIFNDIAPDLVYVSGRMDDLYLKLAKNAKKAGIPTVMGSDKQWHGSIKDRISKILAQFIYHRYFSHVWVAGQRQHKFAEKMSYKSDQIIKGLLSADTSLFSQNRFDIDDSRNDVLYIGRLVEYKGIRELINVLNILKEKGPFTGKLIVYGNGPIKYNLPNYSWIDYKGFGNQDAICRDLQTVRLFVLPSWREPWGVVIHEMAAAGLPIICSSACGAGDAFVEDGVNGYVVPPKNDGLLSNRIERILIADSEELVVMSKKSKELASKFSPSQSAKNLLSII